MALTRAQYLSGNQSQGVVLPGQVQGVKQGPGTSIAADGTISFDASTATGVVKLNSTNAYNAYIWPAASGAAGSILSVDANSQLSWFTNFVRTTGSTGAAQAPAGTTLQRPAPPLPGYFRYNTDTKKFEFYDNNSWEIVVSSETGLFVEKSAEIGGSAKIPFGDTSNRDIFPNGGFTRFNTDQAKLETFNGSSWETILSSATGTFVEKTSPTGSAVLPFGTTLQRDAFPVTGYTRYNTTESALEVYSGTSWAAAGLGANSAGLGIIISGSRIKVAVPCQDNPPAAGAGALQAVDGSLFWSSERGALFIRYNDGTSIQWVQATPSGGGGGGGGGSVNPGLGLTASGIYTKVSIPTLVSAPSPGTGINESVSGSLYWDSNLGVLFIRYNDGDSTQWVQATPGGSGGGGGAAPFVTTTATSKLLQSGETCAVTASVGPTVLTLPAPANPGDTIRIIIAGSFDDTEINGNGYNILGSSSNLVVSSSTSTMNLVFISNSLGWWKA